MNNKKVNIAASALIGFIALVIIVTSVMIYNTPTEVVAGTAGNYSINLTNGGNVLEDEGFLFYTIPGEKGVYRMEIGNLKSVKKISEIGDGNLQVLGSGYYFTDDDTLYRMDWDGNKRQIILKNVKNPKVVGSLVFYQKSNSCSSIYKYSMKNDNDFLAVPDISGFGKTYQEFMVYYKKLYTIEWNRICSYSFDGNNQKLFLEADAEKLSVDGQYFFYIEKGMLKSAMLKDKQIIKTDIVKAENYAIFGSYIVYSDKTGTFHAEINSMLSKKNYKPKKLSEKSAKSISIDENNFYFFIDKTLHKISHDGKNLITLN